MTTANWITLIISLVGVATTWGGVQARLKQVEAKNDQIAELVEKIREELQTSRGSQGGRLGVVEEKVSHGVGVLEGSDVVRRLAVMEEKLSHTVGLLEGAGVFRRKRVATAAAGVATVGGNV